MIDQTSIHFQGTIHPFFNADRSLFETLSNELKNISHEVQVKKTIKILELIFHLIKLFFVVW